MRFHQHFAMFAAYNAWANERLYAAAAEVDDGRRKADEGAFFGSLHRTLSHVLVGDRVWMRRFTGEGPSPTRLDEVPHDDFAALRADRAAEDARILHWVGSLSDAALAANFSYRTITNPTDVTQPLASALAHFFNHQTHHRGQAHALLTRIGGVGPVLDMIAFQRETGADAF